VLDHKDNKDEKEVMLLPFFTFRVAQIEETYKEETVWLKNHNEKD